MNDLYYIVKIHLNRFTKDLSRSLCAFLTGVVGEPDDETSKYVDKEVTKSFKNSLRMERSPAGWLLPARVEGKELHILFKEEPTEEQINIIKKRLPSFESEFMEKDEYSKYIGHLDLKVERIELVRVEVRETPLKILDDPKLAI